jgi:hypothetical protein
MAMRLDHGADELTEVHDINVTPFIDVMLVLLIIFMVGSAVEKCLPGVIASAQGFRVRIAFAVLAY